MNLFDYGVGGIYRIYCKLTNRSYIGQTFSFIYRANQHLEKLRNQTHECKKLQKDWDTYTPTDFTFEILYYEDNATKRLKLEKLELKKYSSNLLYNDLKPVGSNLKTRVAQQVQIRDSIYPSIMSAVKKTGESKTSIIRKLDDPSNLFYVRLKIIDLDKYYVQINNRIYQSTREVVENGLAQTTREVRQKCRSKDWPTWILKERSNDYPKWE